MQRSIPILLWLITLSICIFPQVFACGANPTTIGSYYSGPLLPGATIVFTGAQSHDNDAINGGNIPRWDWDFDYHAPSFQADISTTSAYPSWTYSQAGVYTVAVRYHDEENCIGNVYTFQVTLSGLKRLYYLKDHLGTIRATVDAVGEVVSADDYDPWGMQLEGRSINLADANPKYKFTGKERDVETGYDYFGARYYDARIGRWLSVDPWGATFASWSPYNYTFDNPLRFIDPTGLGPEKKDKKERVYDVKDGVNITSIKFTNSSGKEVTVDVKFQDTDSDKHSSDNKVTESVKTALEGAVKSASENTNITDITITATTNGKHADKSLHYDGKAVDIGAINGKSVTSIGNADPAKALQTAIGNQSDVKENFGPSTNQTNGKDVKSKEIVDDHKNHIHMGMK